ncbi:MAG: FAD-dependent oxidoreductase, partial [Nocardioidaceae bacterium]
MRTAVIGGGVIGLSLAWRLSYAEHTVDLFDDDPGGGASHAAAGMLAPAGEAWFGEDDLVRIGAESLRRWPRFATDLSAAADLDVWLRDEGTLLVGIDDADAANLDRMQGLLDRHGLAAERLTRREARRLEPALATSIRRTVRVRSDLSVHNRRVVEALRRACVRAGARLHPVRADVVTEDGTATGVRERGSDTRHAADTVVVAAGVGLRHVAGVPEAVRAAVRPVKGQILRLRGPEPLLTHTVR